MVIGFHIAVPAYSFHLTDTLSSIQFSVHRLKVTLKCLFKTQICIY